MDTTNDAILAAIKEISHAKLGQDAEVFDLASSYFQQQGVDMESWVPVFSKWEQQQKIQDHPDDLWEGPDNVIVDDAWIAEADKIHHAGQKMMNDRLAKVMSTPFENFMKMKTSPANTPRVTVASSRQSGARKPARRSAARKAASSDDDGDGGDGEPPRPRTRTRHKQQEQQQQQLQYPRFYTYADFAQIFSVTVESLRNAVSAGRIPKPCQTIFGPRFSDEHLNYAIHTRNKAVTPRPKKIQTPPPPENRGRGRPRIAQTLGKGGAA